MELSFTKMQGCANDYIYLDCRTAGVPENIAALSEKLSRRHFSIGADGIICICAPRTAGADAMMRIFNADGSEGRMCGNGIRCVAKYVYDKGLTDKKDITIVSAGKIKYLKLTVEGKTATDRGQVTLVQVNMGNPILAPAEVPVTVEATQETADGPAVVNAPIMVDNTEYHMTCVSMGNPHAIVFMEGVKDLDIEKIGPKFEHHTCFPNRTNTEFVEILDRKNVFMRVWERGTGETLACGTGCCATAVACVLNGLTDEEITVKLLGGELHIKWDRKENLVYMTGPAKIVFEGEVDPYSI